MSDLDDFLAAVTGHEQAVLGLATVDELLELGDDPGVHRRVTGRVFLRSCLGEGAHGASSNLTQMLPISPNASANLCTTQTQPPPGQPLPTTPPIRSTL